jgi:hypothetical protein
MLDNEMTADVFLGVSEATDSRCTEHIVAVNLQSLICIRICNEMLRNTAVIFAVSFFRSPDRI